MFVSSSFNTYVNLPKKKSTHLCFAGDLMIFCKAKVALVSLVKNCLDQFRVASVLYPNLDKSGMFLCGVEPNTKPNKLILWCYL
jgi:hypothetical protein